MTGTLQASWMRAWWLAPASLAGVFVLDALLSRPVSFAARGVGDELAHLLTTVIGLLALLAVRHGRLATPFVAGALVAGNLIDVDHLPLLLGNDVLTEGTDRPYSHSLTFLVTILVLGLLSRGRVASALGGAASGVVVHLARDLATAPVALFWPASFQGVEIPYPAYAVVLAGFASVAAAVSWVERRSSNSDAPA